MDVQEEDAAFVDGSGRAENGGDPLVDVVALGPGAGKEPRQNDIKTLFIEI